LTYKKLDDIIRVQKEKEERTMAKVIIKKHYDKETWKWLTNEEYNVIIEKERLTPCEITERFRTIVMTITKEREI
jgi:hypothetical protein